MIRVQLISKYQGSLTIRKADPIDINTLTSVLKRSVVNDGVVRQVVIDLQFIKLGRTFLKREFEQYGGPDARVVCNIYRLNYNTRRWEKYASGRVNYSNYEVTEDRLTVDVEQVGFQRDVENSLDVPVDLETLVDTFGGVLPANPSLDVSLHGKAISRTFQKTGKEETFHNTDDGVAYFMPGTGMGVVSAFLQQEKLYLNEELETIYELTAQVIDSEPTSIKAMFLQAKVGGSYRFVLYPRLTITTARNISAQIKLVYGQTGAYTTVNVGAVIAGLNVAFGERSLDTTVNLVSGDEVYYFAEVTTSGGSGPDTGQYTFESTSYPPAQYLLVVKALTKAADSTSKGQLLFEAVKRTVQYATGQEDCFKSDLLGRTDLGYAEDGAGSLVAITNGNNIRKREKPIISTLANLVKTVNALYGVGTGYETIDGKQKFVLETKDYFYNKTLQALDLGTVYNVTRRLDVTRLFNQVKFGFNTRIDLDQINATDAFNAIRQYKLPLRNSKNTLDFSTAFKADGYQIEYQRALINQTKDGKLDDENFIIGLVRDGLNYKSKKDEGYDEILNVVDPPSGYNYDFAPGRCLRNWSRYVASSLIYTENKIATFASGEVNYELSTRKTGEVDNVVENGPVDLFGVVPIWTPFVVEFGMKKLTCDDFKELVAKANGYVRAKDVFGVTHKGFVLEVSHNPTTLAADFQLLEMFV